MLRRLTILVLLLAAGVMAQADTCDWLWVTIKIGDQLTAMGKYHLGMKDGMVVDFIDPDDPNYGRDYFPSEWMRTVYLNVKIPDQYKDNLKNWVMPVGDETDPENYRARGRLIRFGEFPTAAQNKIRNALDNGKVLDLTKQYAAWLRPDGTRVESSNWTSNEVKQLFVSSSTLNPPAIDENAISAGSYTVGSGGNYATWAAACADLASMTGDIILSQVSNTTASALASVTIAYNGFSLTIKNDGGYSVDVQTDSYLLISGEGNGTVLVQKMITTQGVNSAAGVRYHFGVDAIVSGTQTITFDRCFSNLNNKAFTRGFYVDDVVPVVNIQGCIAVNSGTRPCFEVTVANANNKIENCTAVTGATDVNSRPFSFTSSAAFTARNCAGYATSGIPAAFFLNGQKGYNNASSDATAADANWSAGSENITNRVAATDFESTTDTDGATYLLPKTTGGLYGTGSNPTISGHTTYINGVTIVTDDVDIGAKGLARATGPAITAAVPDSAIHFGGDSIVVTGSAFTDTGTLVLNTDTITPYRWVTDSIYFVSPAGDTGTFNLIVTDTTDTAKDTTSFRLYFGLAVDSIGPDSLIHTGGTGYAYGTFGTSQGSVTVGGVSATVTNWTNTQIDYTTPLFTTAGNRSATVTDFNGYTASSGADSIYFYLVPQISAVSPSNGTYRGGDTVTITGNYFGDSTASSAVKFGDSTTTLFSWSNTSIQAIIKAGTGTVAVSVTGSDGFSDTLTSAYTFDPKPVVTAISPEGGSRKLTETVTITGTGFLAAQGAGYAAIEDADSTLTITSWSDTSITGTRRTGTAGAQQVIVFNSNGDGDTLAAAFTFDSIPVILSISPAKGDPEGGTTVTLAGVDFEADQGTGAVTFGGTDATSYTSWADGEVVVVSPAGEGSVDVILTTTGALADTISYKYSANNPLERKNLFGRKTWQNFSRRLLRRQ